MGFVSFLTNLLLPPQCLACGKISACAHKLCSTCWSKVNFITDPCCQTCGLPFDFHCEYAFICAACARLAPLFTKGRSAVSYDSISRKMISRLKYNDGAYQAPGLAALLYQAGKGLLKDADYLIPIPLHRWRLLKRQYNQSGLLVRSLAKKCSVPPLFHVLQRPLFTKTQKGLTRAHRQLNVKKAFNVPSRHHFFLKGKIIVLVDDVWTTGTTLTEGCKALLKAGVKEIRVLTVARVLITSSL